MKFYTCKKCDSIYHFIKTPEETLQCCGEPLTELVPNSTDASLAKHIPVVEQYGNQVIIKVGAETHPMVKEHFIEWIVLETKEGYQLKNLHPFEAPMAEFFLSPNDEVLTAYAYCNIHKLWKY